MFSLRVGGRALSAAELERGDMADFDHFERLLKSVLGGELSIDEGARKIALLGEDNKVRVVKGRSVEGLEGFLARGYDSLRAFFPEGPEFTSNEEMTSRGVV
jgi:hypothetical protein